MLKLSIPKQRLWQRLATLDVHLRDVFRDTSYGFLLRVGGGGLAFGANWLLARLLGPSGVGIYYLAFTTITIAAVLSRLGLNETCVRYASPAFAAGDWATVVGVRRTASLLVLAAATVITVILLIAAPAISLYVFHQPELTNTLRVMVVALVPFAWLNIDASMLQSTGHVPAATVVQAVAVPGVFFLLLVLTSLLHAAPVVAAGCYTSATIIVFIVGRWVWRSSVTSSLLAATRYSSLRLLKTGLSIMGVNSISLIMSWTDTVCLGIWSSSSEVGRYNIAVRVALLTSLVVYAVCSAIGPKFAALYGQQNFAALRTLTQRTCLILLAIGLPMLIVLLVIPKIILGLFGNGFSDAYAALMILASAQFILVVVGAVGHLLIMTGHEATLRNILGVSALINVVLNVILVPRFGAVGAATATAISLTLMNILSVALAKKRLGIWAVPKW